MEALELGAAASQFNVVKTGRELPKIVYEVIRDVQLINLDEFVC